MSIIVLLLMLLMHVIEDFHLQGIMAKMKCRQWWSDEIFDDINKHYPYLSPEVRNGMHYQTMRKYRNDYVIVLVLHAFEWAMFIHLPIIVLCFASGLSFTEDFWMIITISVLLNMVVHTYVDDAKANRRSINLVTDQFIHIVQIIVTYIGISVIL